VGESISYKRPDDKDCPGYFAKAATDGAPGLVVIQEWWGLSDQIQRTADRFAEAGFNALVPDLFRGKRPRDEQEANHAMTGLDFVDAAKQDIQGAITHLGASSEKVGVVGFCMGGALTILAALFASGVDAGVCFYGIPPAEAVDPSKIKIPLLCHFAQHDDWCTPAAVDALEKRLKDGHVPFELFRYDAKHGFMRDASDVYHEASANLAWERTVAFLKKTLA
jgi:carboxymethylenebutenolidase